MDGYRHFGKDRQEQQVTLFVRGQLGCVELCLRTPVRAYGDTWWVSATDCLIRNTKTVGPEVGFP